MRLAVEFELRGLGLEKDGILALTPEPRADARWHADIVHELHVLLRIEPVLAQRRLQIQQRRTAGPEAQDFLALERAPVEFVDLLAPHQHPAVGRDEPAEDWKLDR